MSRPIKIDEREDLHVRLDELTDAVTIAITELSNISKLLLMVLKNDDRFKSNSAQTQG